MSYELLPAGSSPVEVGVSGDWFFADVFRCFDASGSSKRHIDHVDPLDGITFWCGHWHEGRGAKLFAELWRDKVARAALAKRASEIGIELATLVRLTDSEFWGRNSPCYQLEWLRELLAYAGRDATIAAWQWRFWVEDVCEHAVEVGREYGIETCGGLATLISAGSSASSWPRVFCAALPRGLSQEQAACWLWARYNRAKHGRVRTRQLRIWDRWYAPAFAGQPHELSEALTIEPTGEMERLGA